jgi:hypothetical protein
MDGHTHESLSDDALEREIEAVLAVDPSPEFRTRVRARVAIEQVRVRCWRSPAWAGLSFAAAAAGLIVMWIIWSPAPSVVETPRIAERAVRKKAPVPEVVTSESPVIRVERRTPTQDRRREPPIANPAEVLVSPHDAVALRQLVAAVASQRLEPTAFPEFGVEPAALAAIEDIVVEPITLSPIVGLKSE